jgi:hypothetical protein
MISIQNEIRTAEDLQALVVAVNESYGAAIRDSSQYAIHFDDSFTPAHREALQRIADRILTETAVSAAALPPLRSAVRSVLRDYKEKAEQYLADLRAKLEEHTDALQAVLSTLTADCDDQGKKMRGEMRRLGELRSAAGLEEMRAGLIEIKGSLEGCIEEMEKRNRITVAGLTSEIQALQRQVEQLKAPGSNAGGVGVRERVDSETAAGNSFLLLFARIRNLESIRSRFGPELTARVVRCALKRLNNLPVRNLTVGSWQEGVLCAVITDADRSGVALARDANSRLSGKYVFSESDRVIEIPAQIVTTSLDRPSEDTPERTATRISEALKSLGQ